MIRHFREGGKPDRAILEAQIIASALFPSNFMFDKSWTLTTERLAIRHARADDFPFLTGLWTNAQVRRFLGGPIQSEEAVRRIRARVDARELLLVSARDDGQPVGVLCVSDDGRQIELSYLLMPGCWLQGYATEATAALCQWLAAAFVDRNLVAITQAANKPSCKLLLRLGFQEQCRHIEFDELQITYVLKL